MTSTQIVSDKIVGQKL